MARKIQRSNMTQTDAKGRITREPREDSASGMQNLKWWKLEGAEMAHAIGQTIKFIALHQANRIEQLTVSTRLYGSMSAYNLMGTAFTRASSVNSNPGSQRLSYNLCQSVVDTLVSKMAKNKVIPTYITNGGVWDVQKKAKDLTKFTQGLFYQENVHKKTIDCFRDAGVWGDGFVYIFRKDDKVCVERVVPHEIFVDMIETLVGPPTQLHRVKIMDRGVAKELFPELEEHIDQVSPANYQEIGGQGTAADLISVAESWHLKSGPDAEDGLHVITIGEGVLCDEYEKDYFPFAHFTYSSRVLGYYGQGACERLQNLQGEINRGMLVIQRSHWMMAGPKIAVEYMSKIPTQHLTNDIASIIHYNQNPPVYLTPPIIQPEVYQWVDSLIDKGYRQEGVSRMSASAEKPIGLDSGKAIRTMTNVEDDRFLFMEQEMEALSLEIARQSVAVVKDIYKDKQSYAVVFPTTRFMETVDWADINLDESEYVLKAYPTSSLSEDLSGRLADIQELAQAGMISPRTARRLMDMPDVEMNDNLSNAAEDVLHKLFENILDEGEYRAPEPTFDLKLAKELVLDYLNYADYMNAPEDKLNLLRQFNSQLDEMQAQAAMAPPPGAAPGAPQAVPTPPPTSNLIPNVPGAA